MLHFRTDRAFICVRPALLSAHPMYDFLHLSATVAAAMAMFAATSVTAYAQNYSLTTLATFNGTDNGKAPYSNLILHSSGNLYGTTEDGGASSDGTVFEIAAGTNTITTLATFTGTNGANPEFGLTLDSSGNLYGTTSGGGASNDGTVFKIAAGTNMLTTLATFTGINGANPWAALTLDSSGNLYGTTLHGGASDDGTVFKIAAGTNTITTLATFTGTNGAYPFSSVAFDGSGNLYGTTQDGGTGSGIGYGTVFKIAAGTNTLTTIASFDGTNGQAPDAGVTLDSSGNLYGTTVEGGSSNRGTVFKIAAGTNNITTLVTFNFSNGDVPISGLTLDGSGNFFGTTTYGGANGDGTVFEFSSATNTFTTLATFNNTNGEGPLGNLTLDSSGNIYGTTFLGGANGDGTVFKLTPTGGAAAPEPSALLLLAPGALGLLAIRRISCRANARHTHNVA